MKTLTIAGHAITLEEGRNYLAARPMADSTRKHFPVTVYDTEIMATESKAASLVYQALDMTYDEANEFLAEFNNGKMSFDGRVW